MAKKDLILNGKKFISSKRAAQITGYTQDYVGQLARGEKIEATVVGRSWFVSEDSILHHKKENLNLRISAKSSRKLRASRQFSDTSPRIVNPAVSAEKADLEESKPNVNFFHRGVVEQSGLFLPALKKSKTQFVSSIGKRTESLRLPGTGIFGNDIRRKTVALAASLMFVIGSYLSVQSVIANGGIRSLPGLIAKAGDSLSATVSRAVVTFSKTALDVSSDLLEVRENVGALETKLHIALSIKNLRRLGQEVVDGLRGETRKLAGGFEPVKLFSNLDPKVLTAAAPDPVGALQSAARRVHRTVNGAVTKVLRSLAGLFNGNAVQSQMVVNQPTTIIQNRNVRPIVVEGPRTIVERVTREVPMAVSVPSDVDAKLNQLENRLRGEIAKVSGAAASQTYVSNVVNNITNAIAGTNNIDMLHRVTIDDSSVFTAGTIKNSAITNSTITNSSISGDSGSFTTLDVSGTTTVDTSTLVVDPLNNRVGIGTSSPSDTLAVNGSVYLSPSAAPIIATDRLYNIGNSLHWGGNLIGSATTGVWTLSNGNVYRETGSVGISTTSPYTRLSVEGDAVFGSATTTSLFATGTLRVSGTSLFSSLATFVSGFISQASSTVAGPLTVTGAVNASSTLALSGKAEIGGALSASSTADILGLSTLRGGFVSLASSSVNSDFTVTGNLAVRGATTFTNTATTTYLGDIQTTGLSALNFIETSKFLATSTTATSKLQGLLTVTGAVGASSTLAVEGGEAGQARG